MKTKLLTICLLLFTSQVFAWTVSCEGYDYSTSDYVYGECWDGDFEGYADNGEYYYGDCDRGGSFDAYNSDSGTYADGDCDDD